MTATLKSPNAGFILYSFTKSKMFIVIVLKCQVLNERKFARKRVILIHNYCTKYSKKTTVKDQIINQINS